MKYRLILKLKFLLLMSIFLGTVPTNAFPGEDEWHFLSTEAIGARQFIKAHPESDGRGVVIFILDSGVDMGVAGLLKTTDGKVKVIDVRDFSGQGDVLLYTGKKGSVDDEKFIEHPDGFRLFNYHLLEKHPVDDEYLIGYLDESRFKNSRVNDLNNNGRSDDVFGVLVFEVESPDSLYWLAYVDTDGDFHLEDEKPIRDYRINFDSIRLRGGDSRYDRRMMTLALNILPYDMKVSFHFDDDGHGTHVAGIAAGCLINNQENYNGVAPGAQIISLKIGSGIYEGGCTTSGSLRSALNFVEEYVRQNKKPVVVNLSYGIGSIREGQSDADRLINNILGYNENIFISISNGNEGPGISTTGTPAAADLAFSVGAYLPADVANKVYGANLDHDIIFDFSTRGGELNKPDAIAPGAAASSVPNFTDNDNLRGTSMAAPQVSGAAALLFSSVDHELSAKKLNSAQIKKVLKNSAQPLPNYTPLDQGHGVIDVPAAFNLLQTLINDNTSRSVDSYDISTNCPLSFNSLSQAGYWRTGGFFPDENDPQIFYINPIFHDSLDANQRAEFYRAFNLKSSQPWLVPEKKSIYIKGENPAAISVRYDKKLINKPGLYCGKIYAFQKGSKYSETAALEFELLSTVIVPYTFDHSNNYQQKFENQKLNAGDLLRYFILVPTGATTAKIDLTPAKNKFCRINGCCYDPAGKKYFETNYLNSTTQNVIEQLIPSDDLVAGIWEIDVYADFLNSKTSTYDLTITFCSFDIDPPVISNYNYQIGREPGGQFVVTNQFNVPFYGFGSGEMLGYLRTRQKSAIERDVFDYDFKPEADVKKVEFLFDFDDDSFLKFSDVAVNIYDAKRKTIVKEALTFDKGSISFNPVANEYYTLEVKAASVYPIIDTEWKFELTEKYYINEEIKIKVYAENDRVFRLYPSIPKKLDFTLEKSARIAPDGFSIFGQIKFFDRNLFKQEFSVPIIFNGR